MEVPSEVRWSLPAADRVRIRGVYLALFFVNFFDAYRRRLRAIFSSWGFDFKLWRFAPNIHHIFFNQPKKLGHYSFFNHKFWDLGFRCVVILAHTFWKCKAKIGQSRSIIIRRRTLMTQSTGTYSILCSHMRWEIAVPPIFRDGYNLRRTWDWKHVKSCMTEHIGNCVEEALIRMKNTVVKMETFCWRWEKLKLDESELIRPLPRLCFASLRRATSLRYAPLLTEWVGWQRHWQ